MPLRLEAAIFSRTRSPISSRSNWANDSSTLSVSRPMLELVLKDCVTDTNEAPWPSNSSISLAEEFPGDSGRANFRYYEPRCSHGSSLSGAMHGLVAARLGDSDLALRYFQHAVAIDLADNHTTIAGGLHMAALGGTWLTAVFGFAGLSLQRDGI